MSREAGGEARAVGEREDVRACAASGVSVGDCRAADEEATRSGGARALVSCESGDEADCRAAAEAEGDMGSAVVDVVGSRSDVDKAKG